MNKKKRIIPILIILALAAGGFALWRRTSGGGDSLRASGVIEAVDSSLSFKIAGRLAERKVEEGDSVTSGQELARIDGVDLEIAAARSAANFAAAQATLAELEAGTRPEEIRRALEDREQARAALRDLEAGSRPQEIAAAKAELERCAALTSNSLAQLDLAQADNERFAELYRNKTIEKREYQIYRTKYESSIAAVAESRARESAAREALSLRREGARLEELQKARAALRRAEAQYDLSKAGARAETIAQARAQAAAARESLRQAQRQLYDARLTAPFPGVVLSKSAEPGEYMNPGTPVLVLGRLNQVWLRAYIPETQLGLWKLGQECEVSTDSHPGKFYRGRVSYIGDQAEFSPKSVQTFEERVKLMFRIKIDLENPNQELKPGMPADARLAHGTR